MKIHKLGSDQILFNMYCDVPRTGAFYFTLGNISPKYRSRISSIQLVALVNSDHICCYGMDKVLKPIVEDIKKLVSIALYKTE